jgi:electron transfer flavoprotein alpha subunit
VLVSGILVLVEHLRGEVRDVSYEMLAKARQLSDAANCKVSAVVLGCPVADIAAKISGFCDNLLALDNEALKDFNAEAYQQVLTGVIAEEKPSLAMIAHSAQGVDLAPALAVSTGLPLVSDVVGISYDASGFLLTRQMYAGKLNADWRFKGEAGMVTVRSGAFKSGTPKSDSANLRQKAYSLERPLRRKFLGYEEAPVTGVDITKAGIIVAVGRGIKDQKNLPMIEQFAKAIGGEIGCSRPVIDAGWLTKDRQIGSSGKTVKPKLYIGLGISGAFQHTAGIKGAETIIAVNKDPNAPIFAMAQYGIVGDIMKIVPALEAKIRELKSE